MSTVERRQERARQGSGRKRDLAAGGLTGHADRENAKRVEEQLAQREREVRLRPQVRSAPAADSGWASAREALRSAIPASTFGLWIEPLRCIGDVSGALAIEAPDGLFAWVFRRYGALLGHAVREADGDYRGAFLFRAEPPGRSDEDGLL